MKRKFLLATAKGRTAWIFWALVLLSLPTSAVIAARTSLHELDTAAPIVTITEDRQIPDWEEPLDPNFLDENDVPAPVTYDPFKSVVEQTKIQDPKSDSAEKTEFHETNDPSRWPDSTTVKVIATWPSADTTECSGVLIAENTILTAGHCVFTHTAKFCEAQGSCWAADLQIFTHYGTQDEEESGYTKILTWTAWTQNRDYEYDLAGVRLKQAFGHEDGWLGYGYNKETENDFFLSKTFEHKSYSGNTLLTWKGEFTRIDEHQFYSDKSSEYGQSGAGAHSNEYFHIVYSVLSHHQDFGSTTQTAHTRITAHKFFALRDWIKGFMDDPDFIIYLPFFAD